MRRCRESAAKCYNVPTESHRWTPHASACPTWRRFDEQDATLRGPADRDARAGRVPVRCRRVSADQRRSARVVASARPPRTDWLTETQREQDPMTTARARSAETGVDHGVSTDRRTTRRSPSCEPDGTIRGLRHRRRQRDRGAARRRGRVRRHPTSTVVAGSWAGRWDISVGSMTITDGAQGGRSTSPRPYYYTPAQMAVATDSRHHDARRPGRQDVCVGERRRTSSGSRGRSSCRRTRQAKPAAGGQVDDLGPTPSAPRHRVRPDDFQGWLTAIRRQAAIADGVGRRVGDPVFYEPLAVAFDKPAPTHDELAGRASTRSSARCTRTER